MKVFQNNLNGDFDLDPFRNMKTKILPHVLGWVGRDVAGGNKKSDMRIDIDMDDAGDTKNIGTDDAGDEKDIMLSKVYFACHEYGDGSAEHYQALGLDPPRPKQNRLLVIYGLVRHVPSLLLTA